MCMHICILLFTLFDFSFVDFPSVLWYCWLGLLTCKKTGGHITSIVFLQTLNHAQWNNLYSSESSTPGSLIRNDLRPVVKSSFVDVVLSVVERWLCLQEQSDDHRCGGYARPGWLRRSPVQQSQARFTKAAHVWDEWEAADAMRQWVWSLARCTCRIGPIVSWLLSPKPGSSFVLVCADARLHLLLWRAPECIAPNIDISFQSGRFWATSIASFGERLLENWRPPGCPRTVWMKTIQYLLVVV